ncbi:hypothetical protein D3C76_1247120 [compost metagenome]
MQIDLVGEQGKDSLKHDIGDENHDHDASREVIHREHDRTDDIDHETHHNQVYEQIQIHAPIQHPIASEQECGPIPAPVLVPDAQVFIGLLADKQSKILFSRLRIPAPIPCSCRISGRTG